MAKRNGRPAVPTGGLAECGIDPLELAKALYMVQETHASLLDSEYEQINEMAAMINDFPTWGKMSSTARFMVLFHLIQWGVATIDGLIEKGNFPKPN